MTPEQVAAIRHEHRSVSPNDKKILALCDALTAAWAERDGLRDERDASNDSNLGHCDLIEKLQVDAGLCDCENLRERAERAERRAAELEDGQTEYDQMSAALARVRALCYHPHGDIVVVDSDEIRAAIEGDNQ